MKKQIFKVKPHRNRLDAKWSKIIRARDQFCQKCGRVDGTPDAAHILSRVHLSTRYSLANGIRLCKRDHKFWWHDDPVLASDWVRQKFGDERIKWLIAESSKLIRWSPEFVAATETYLDAELARLEK